MSKDLNQVLVKKFENEAIQAFQDSGTDLQSAVRVRDAKGAQQVQFQVYGDLEAYERTSVHTPIPTTDPSLTPKVATVKNYTVSIFTDIFLNNQVGFDARQEATTAIGMAGRRRMDQVVLDALDAAKAGSLITKTVADDISGSADNLTVATFAEAAKLLGSDVPDMDRHMITHDNNFYHFIQETDVKTIDSNLRKPLTDGKLSEYMGFKIHKMGDRAIGGLAVPSSNHRTNWYFQKQAIGLALNMAPKVTIDWEPGYGAHRVTLYASAGAVVIQPSGVVDATVDES